MKILAADLGGTHSRFALFKKDAQGLCLQSSHKMPSAGTDFRRLLEQLLQQWDCPDLKEAGALSFAAAGPVCGGRIRMTNAPLTITQEDAAHFFPDARFLLMNDFEAQAWACLSGIAAGFESLLPGSPPANHGGQNSGVLCAAVGAGTGLGTAWITRTQQGTLFASASEAGHAPFPFFGKEERDIAAFLQSRLGKTQISAENVLSGSGLSLLHEFCTGRSGDPAGFTASGTFGTSACCAFFARFYGRFCRTAALCLLPSRLVVTGGVAGRTPALARHPEFSRAFLEGQEAAGDRLLKTVPVLLNRHPQSGLWGAAWAAACTESRKED